ncbi:hypothetical protein SUGI_0703960 [Cryptomeria japonica]|nr:hypothetical protein SUGI_0703960 [Cryptomeria japonica]
MMGVVASRERKDKFLKFQVDDGTVCVLCILWLNHLTARYYSRVQKPQLQCIAVMTLEQAEEVQLSRLVKLQGRVTSYNRQLQLTVKFLLDEIDPNAEIHHWMDCICLVVRSLKIWRFFFGVSLLTVQLLLEHRKVRCYYLLAPLPPKHNANHPTGMKLAGYFCQLDKISQN